MKRTLHSYRQDAHPELVCEDLLKMEQDERFQGFGYLGHEVRRAGGWYGHSRTPYMMPALVDQTVVDAANCRNWNYEQLFFWANSRDARHTADEICGIDSSFDSERERDMCIDASMNRIVQDEDFPPFPGGGKACRCCGDEMQNGECAGCGYVPPARGRAAR